MRKISSKQTNYDIIKLTFRGGIIMQVTDIRVRQVFDEGKMKARVSVTFDNQFVVHEIKVLDGENGLFIAMPSKKLPTGEYKDIAHPINKETRLMIQELILEAYEQKLAEEEASEE